jgi:hypothetical protein
MAVLKVIPNAPIWLEMSMARRFMRSEKTPIGKDIKRAGKPMTKSSMPLTSDFAPNSKMSQTNANR